VGLRIKAPPPVLEFPVSGHLPFALSRETDPEVPLRIPEEFKQRAMQKASDEMPAAEWAPSWVAESGLWRWHHPFSVKVSEILTQSVPVIRITGWTA
jgi:hypothetical protein